MVIKFLILGLVLYSGFSLLIWQERFYYDDELINLGIISKYDYSELINYVSDSDIHPPGQYIINKFTYDFLGRNEWLMSLPSLICSGISIGLVGLIIFKITKSKITGAIGVLISSISPLFLMWGWSIRWYPFWTFVTLLSVSLLLKIWENNLTNKLYYFSLLLLLTIGLYINHLTIIFFASIILTSFAVDYGKNKHSWKHTSKTITYKVSLIILAAFIFFSPWLLVFKLHFINFFGGIEIHSAVFNRNPFFAAAYVIFSSFFGSSIYPWNQGFVILFTGLTIAIIIGLYFFLRNQQHKFRNLIKNLFKESKEYGDEALRIFVLFTLFFLLLMMLLSFLTKSFRSQELLIFPLLLSIIIVVSLYNIKKKIYAENNRKLVMGYSYLIIAEIFFVGIWLIGTINIINSQHFHKLGLSDPIELVLEEIKKIVAEEDEPIILITTNPVLTFYLQKNSFNVNMLIASPYIKSSANEINEGLKKTNIIFIESYLGSLIPVAKGYEKIADYIKKDGEVIEQLYLSKDEDYRIKKKIMSAAYLPEYRFVINMLKPKTKWDLKKIFSLNDLKVY